MTQTKCFFCSKQTDEFTSTEPNRQQSAFTSNSDRKWSLRIQKVQFFIRKRRLNWSWRREPGLVLGCGLKFQHIKNIQNTVFYHVTCVYMGNSAVSNRNITHQNIWQSSQITCASVQQRFILRSFSAASLLSTWYLNLKFQSHCGYSQLLTHQPAWAARPYKGSEGVAPEHTCPSLQWGQTLRFPAAVKVSASWQKPQPVNWRLNTNNPQMYWCVGVWYMRRAAGYRVWHMMKLQHKKWVKS